MSDLSNSYERFKEALNNSSVNSQSTKSKKCDCCFSLIFDDLKANENGGTSMYRGNSELIRVSLIFIFNITFLFFILQLEVVAEPQDLSGYWEPLIMEDFELRTKGSKKGDYGGIELNDAARAVADEFSRDKGGDEFMFDRCGPHGPPAIMFTDTRLHITQDDRMVTMQLEAEGQTRYLYLDNRQWPGGELQRQGHSIAYEDGRSLLTVITRHMQPGQLRDNGVPYSEEAVLTEHYSRHGDYFTVIQALEDPEFLDEPFVRNTSFHKIPEPGDWQMGGCIN